MKADALDAQTEASLFEFSRAVAGAHRSQIREQQPFVRQCAQNRVEIWTKTDEHHFTCFHSRG